jgi:hypothetical protein
MSALGKPAYEAGDVLPSQFKSHGGKYPDFPFVLGFFCGICVYSYNVTIDFNGYTFSQSLEHALHQRFFAIIELASQPFIPKQGPANFGPTLLSGSYVTIFGGTIGLSAHHGIHGNGASHITIRDMNFIDYEVAAIALNGCKHCSIKNVLVLGNRKNIPVVGTFSSARFIRPYINYLVNSASNVTLDLLSGSESVISIRDTLRYAINNVTMDILNGGTIDKLTHSTEYAVFHNPSNIIDGNAYGILFNKLGVAVNGHPAITGQDENLFSQDIHLENVTITREYSDIKEIIALSDCSSTKIKPVIDPVGAVFQSWNKDPISGNYITISDEDETTARYQGNIIANAQALVGKAALLGEFSGTYLDVTRSAFNEDLLNWIETDSPLSSYTDSCPSFCNGDSMFHVMKGLIGLKMDGVIGATIKSLHISDLRNFGMKGSDKCSYNTTTFSHPLTPIPGYNGAKTIGITISGSRDIHFSDITIDNIKSLHGRAIGIDILLDSSNISIRDLSISNVMSGSNESYPVDGPNFLPLSIGIKISKSATDIDLVTDTISIDGLNCSFGNYLVFDERRLPYDSESNYTDFSNSGNLIVTVAFLLIFLVLI